MRGKCWQRLLEVLLWIGAGGDGRNWPRRNIELTRSVVRDEQLLRVRLRPGLQQPRHSSTLNAAGLNLLLGEG
jgi:hypothetical protein